MEKVVRNLGEVNISKESRKVEGYALLFNTQSKFIGWYETIERGAITDEVINNSDVFALFNHDRNKVLARSEYGKGSLKLEIDEKGLKYSFEAPKTALGDELLEYLERGDIHQSSFAFMVDFGDDTMVKREYRDGDIYYTIKHIPVLLDVSPVWQPAYAETYVGKRALELCEEMRKQNENIEIFMNEEIRKEEEIKEEVEQEEQTSTDEENEETDNSTEEEQPSTDEEKDEPSTEDEEVKEEKVEEKEEKRNNNQGNITKGMKKERFSLLKAIRSVANNQEFDAASKAVIEKGAEELRNSGLTFGGQIQIPTGVEYRDGITVSGVHDDLVVTDFTSILEPLQKKNVLVQSGAKLLQGLKGDVTIPLMSNESCGFVGEIQDAPDGTGDWNHIALSPRRLAAYIDVSKMFLQQDTLGAEQLIVNELVNAINSKIEDSILSDAAATATKPAGVFYGLTPVEVSDFKSLTDAEADVEEANIYGEMRYIVSPTAKAALRNMPRSADHTRLVMEGSEVDGTPALSTTHMAANSLAYGDWSNLAIAIWGNAVNITVDPYSLSRSGLVRIVAEIYVNWANLREGSIVYGTISE